MSKDLLKRVMELEERSKAISSELKTTRRKLKGGTGVRSFKQLIANAVAEGETKTVAKLRQERDEAERVVDDLRAAKRVVDRKLRDARAKFADATMPEVASDVETALAAFNEAVRTVQAAANELNAKYHAYRRLASQSKTYRKKYRAVTMPPADLPTPEGMALHLLRLLNG